MLLSRLKSNLPPRNRSTPQYYTCFGRVHVQTALQLIIIVTFAWDIYRWIDFIGNRNVLFGWVEIFAEICNALFGISLIIAYCFKSAFFLLPYLFLQLFTLVALMILLCVSVLTIIWPKNSWAPSFHTYPQTKPSTIRLNALLYALSPLTFALMLIWVIRVLFACYVYFSDQKKAEATFPVVTIQNNGPDTDITIASSNEPSDVTTTIKTMPIADIPIKSTAPVTFSNPNFILQDEDNENRL
uniref:MARVEL domain-containing protein n=1 Tax=Setaria digitata TaxID=48799 RepID=A0A915PGB4_9BILA